MATRAADNFNTVSIQIPGQAAPIVRPIVPVLNSGGSYTGGLGVTRVIGTDVTVRKLR
ncbi:hypothetical protein [Massilia eurypsychrophila]|jgi:hypothetical protein|uniref:hypothetical protein n=1 Tax=Massilia eurypsychrophila TaxID=1485217 RepID=UPI0015D4BB0F|nr:hypothetical protein [Massilia eurypsychrophila]